MQHIHSFSTDIEIVTAEYNATFMAEEIESKCTMDKRIITTNPFASSDSRYALIHNAISICIQHAKRIVVMETSTYFNADVVFTGLDDSIMGQRCAIAAHTNNQTEILLQTKSSYPHKNIFIYTASDEHSISMQYRTHKLQEKITELGGTPVLLSNNITSSSYNVLKNSYTGDTMLIGMGIDACEELNERSITFDMNCGDNSVSTRFYGVHMQMYLLSTIEVARNFTIPSTSYNIQSLTSNLSSTVPFSYSNDCAQITHPDFFYIGDYTWAVEHEIKRIDDISITQFSIESLSRISVDYCNKNSDCNGFAIHRDTFQNVVSMQFAKHVSTIFQSQNLMYSSCAYRKQVPTSTSIACTHDMSSIPNIRLLFYSVDFNNSQQYCGSQAINPDNYITSYVHS
jgi:hypothetical protein